MVERMITINLTDVQYEAIIKQVYEAGYNKGFADIVKNCSICHHCDIYRDAWNFCFVASECLTNDFKYRKRRIDGGENDK